MGLSSYYFKKPDKNELNFQILHRIKKNAEDFCHAYYLFKPVYPGI